LSPRAACFLRAASSRRVRAHPLHAHAHAVARIRAVLVAVGGEQQRVDSLEVANDSRDAAKVEWTAHLVENDVHGGGGQQSGGGVDCVVRPTVEVVGDGRRVP
jgi:hypothetical protein